MTSPGVTGNQVAQKPQQSTLDTTWGQEPIPCLTPAPATMQARGVAQVTCQAVHTAGRGPVTAPWIPGTVWLKSPRMGVAGLEFLPGVKAL